MRSSSLDTVPVTVRRAVPADAPRLASLSGVLGYPVDEASFGRRLEAILARPQDLVLVAESSPDVVVGWLHGAEQELLESGRRCEILGLVVDPAHRGQGAGRLLVQAVEVWAVQRGLELMTVRSNVIRTESHPFYERLGYTRNKTQHAYRKPLARTESGSQA
jgi:GNAT superfamily N-acetyltransferase